MADPSDYNGLEIAVIGLACRFPGADNREQFWNNLKDGLESVTVFTDEELRREGVTAEFLSNENYVKAGAVLDRFEYFDERFFGYSPKDALVMDPQVRLFHEVAWESLEDAGYVPDTYPGLIGVFAGASSNYNWNARVYSYEGEHRDAFSEIQLSNKDFLASRISYKFNLKGPSMTLTTACSTSLTAIHTACRSLLSGECDMAIAGGSSILIPHRSGYLYQEGHFLSKDGHIRAFDEQASGILFGNGTGAVVLKPLENALADKDHIWAVIKGSAVNNDGNRKAGYMAPSVEGQREVIESALQVSEVGPDSISYIETHGTGTQLGDTIEFTALQQVFHTRQSPCILGSVKNNIGHLDAASGVAGFMKAVLALKHRQIPPMVNFSKSNPLLEMEKYPFAINTKLLDWPLSSYPLRAGVSSFGVGGMNAHLILEQAPLPVEEPEEDLQPQLILLSAQSMESLENMTENLAHHVEEHPDIRIRDVAYTLQAGRKPFEFRKQLICRDRKQLIEGLRKKDARQPQVYRVGEAPGQIVFMFPGQGAQYVNMGRELYHNEPIFRTYLDQCFAILRVHSETDYRAILFPSEEEAEQAREFMARLDHSLVILFIFGYALAELLMEWGIKPDVVIGYSLGEYIAGTVSGLFTLEQAIPLVLKRGRLFQQLPDGIMLSIPLPPDKVLPLLGDSLEIAIDNQVSCVVGGPAHSVLELEEKLKQSKCVCTPLPMSKVIHTSRVESILDEYRAALQPVQYQPMKLRLMSSVTGDWAGPEELATSQYWIDQLQEKVSFVKAVQHLADKRTLFIEIGPGHDLSALVKRTFGQGPNVQVLNLIPIGTSKVSEQHHLYDRIGKLWQYGYSADWNTFNPQGRRIPLPTYAFMRKKFWLEEPSFPGRAGSQPYRMNRKNIEEWYYVPSWKRLTPVSQAAPSQAKSERRRLIFGDHSSAGQKFTDKWKTVSEGSITVYKGEQRAKWSADELVINPARDEDYEWLFQELHAGSFIPDEMIHLWSLSFDQKEAHALVPDAGLDDGYYSLLAIAKACGQQLGEHPLELRVITNGVCEVMGGDGAFPHKATMLGPVKVIPFEYPSVRCSLLDMELLPDDSRLDNTIDSLVSQLAAAKWESVAAYRNNSFWVPTCNAVTLDTRHAMKIQPHGKYLITGGLGGIGLAVAGFLAQQDQVELILAGRTPFPPKEEWAEWSAPHFAEEIHKLTEIENSGGTVHILQADISDPAAVQALLTHIEHTVGELTGVIHAAGVADGELIQRSTRESSKNMLAAKVDGTLSLFEALRGKPLDFFILCSSLSSYLPAIGQAGYCAANAFLDSFAFYAHAQNPGFPVLSVNWERWRQTGMSRRIEALHKELTGSELEHAITEGEGIQIFSRIGNLALPQVIISAFDMNERVQLHEQAGSPLDFEGVESISHQQPDAGIFERPSLTTEYVSPRNEREREIAQLWEAQFGVQPVGIDDSLFELGGDSLMALSILARVQKQWNERIPMAYFINHPTVAGISSYMEQATPIMSSGVKPVARREYYPLTSVQKRVYFLQKMHSMTTVYNNPGIYQLESDIGIGLLRQIFQKILQRHEILRTSFGFAGEEAVQTVHQSVEFSIEELDEHEAGMDAVIAGFIRPFELEKAPLLRVGYLRDKRILLIDMHHLVSDEMSYRLLIKDFLALYEGRDLTVLPLQYKDYAAWQSGMKGSPAFVSQQQYWLDQFADGAGETRLPLPLDFKPPLVQSFEGDFIRFDVDADTSRRFKQWLKTEGVTLNMGLLALYAVVLFKICQQETVIIGTPVSGRKHTDLEHVIGPFVDTVALKLSMGAEASFAEFLQEVKQTLSSALDHQDYPFEELIGSLDLEQDLSRNPLFETMFSYREVYDKTNQIGGVREITSFYRHKTAMFTIRFTAWEEGPQIGCEIEYSTTRLAQETMQRFAGFFEHLMQQVLHGPARPLAEIAVMTDIEKQQILFGFNQTQSIVEPGHNIVSLFERQAEEHPEKIAVAAGLTAMSYLELNHAVNQLAHYLQKNGVTRGTPVGIYLERSPDAAVAILAVLKAGGCYVPVDPSIPIRRILQIQEEAGLAVMLSTSGLTEQAKLECGRMILLDREREAISQESSANPGNGVEASQTAYMIFTSGSTGKPKGVKIPHRALTNFLLSMAKKPGMTAEDKLLSVTTLSFDIFGLELFLPLVTGALVVLATNREAADGRVLGQLLAAHGITVMQATPATWKMLLLSGYSGSSRLKALCGGESLPPDVARELLPKVGSLWNMYGPTETTIWSTVAEITNAGQILIGKPIDNTQIYILDQNRNPVPLGVYGEMYIGGAGVADGYVNHQQLTEKNFVGNPFSTLYPKMYRTGDLARFLPDGTLQCEGRMDDQVKIRGFRIELSEIQAVIAAYPGIKDNVVVLESNVPNEEEPESGDKKSITSYMVPAGPEAVHIDELKSYLLERLPSYMIPVQFFIIDQIPLSANQKTDKKKLRTMQQKLLVSAKAYKEPVSELEKQISSIWMKLLHKETISITDSYFDLGGTSITVVLLQEQMREAFGVPLQVADIFSHPTIERLAGFMERKMTPEASLLLKGIKMPSGYYLTANDRNEQMKLRLELEPAAAQGLVHIANSHGMRTEEVILSLLYYVMNQISREEMIEITLLDGNHGVHQACIDFSELEDFDSLFIKIRDKVSDIQSQHSPAENIRIEEKDEKNLFLLFPLTSSAAAGLSFPFNALWTWEISRQEKIIVQLDYDGLLWKAAALSKVVQGFTQLANQLASRLYIP
ncbi:non-ribosomal peptide synthetase/type I polyketide synthase [Paenibacillus sonchi]|uniref:non-ribosomal peptide synthetase/type I polyketide synthase n=1 Tax=Paenibacillus sonchi TaxID=373687 RepID=UPI001E5260B4|nr:non-ribosomal peptide synthetase/type I polyketide synthase [Paenibacillus sonchi]MCE3199531.1 amino acid adenylation domain-containing protein [Paenibacillus sonchi]